MHGGAGAGTIELLGGGLRTAGRPDGRRFVFCAFAVLWAVRPSGRLAAQDTVPIIVPADTMHHGVRPMGAFLRSFILPGWGQAATDRPMTGAAFVAWEGITAMMTLKAQQEANYLQAIHSKNVQLKRQEVQYWIVLGLCEHLFSGAEAYGPAHPRDFPPHLKVQAAPPRRGIC